jgi:hypothetical protein
MKALVIGFLKVAGLANAWGWNQSVTWSWL